MLKCYSNENRYSFVSLVILYIMQYRPEIPNIDILCCQLTNISSSNWQRITILVSTPMSSGVNESREITWTYLNNIIKQIWNIGALL